MTISNSSKDYIKIQSDFIQQVIDNLSDYSGIKVTGNVNCCKGSCGSEESSSYTLDLTGLGWKIDLDQAVKLELTLQTLQLESLIGHNLVNALATPVDLKYVNDTCLVGSCQLQDFSTHFTPLFKIPIDAFFASIGILSDVTISFDGNVLIINNLPSNFAVAYAELGSSVPYDQAFAGFGSITTPFYMGSDGLYILPSFFSLTEFTDGIYTFEAKIYKTDSWTSETNCAFVDITIKCRVASTLARIIDETKNSLEEPCATTLHLLHYGLVNGSNCGCNCDELCLIYRELIKLLDTQVTTDCGCSQ